MDQLCLTPEQINQIITATPYDTDAQECKDCRGAGVCPECYALDDHTVWGVGEDRENPLCHRCRRIPETKEKRHRLNRYIYGPHIGSEFNPPAEWEPPGWLQHLHPRSVLPQQLWIEQGRYGVCKSCAGQGHTNKPTPQWLRQTREAAGVKARIFAPWAGVSYGYIMQLEVGIVPMVNDRILAAYCLLSQDGPEAAALRAAAVTRRA